MSIESLQEKENQLKHFIEEGNRKAVSDSLKEMHAADIAELFDDLTVEEQYFVMSVLNNELSSSVLLELEDSDRRRLLESLSNREIADEVQEMDSDDAADVILELPEERKQEVIDQLKDKEQAKDIVDLIRYDESTAGGLMRKEYVVVNSNWSVITSVREMRKQAEEMDEVFSIYVVDNSNKLLGTLSLKKLLTTSSTSIVEKVFNPKYHYVTVNEPTEEIAQVFQKYDLLELPVVDELGHLVGNITVDDVIDFMRDEAEKDYQLASGITQDVEANDSILDLTKARIPWLILGLFGGITAAYIMGDFEEMLSQHTVLFYFTPLIGAMAGNVGVQSSAIIVQGLANNDLKGSTSDRLFKEVKLAMLNGLILATILMTASYLWKGDLDTSIAISLSLFTVIIIAALIGTFVPIALDKRGIDPAIATGPFITTSNDVIGITLYFLMAKMVLGI